MVKVDLPRIRAQATAREAFDLLRTRGRRAIVVDLAGGDYALVYSHVVLAAARNNLVLTQIPGLQPIQIHTRFPGMIELHELQPQSAIIKISPYIAPLFEQGPPICQCPVCGTAGTEDGSVCPNTPCPGRIVCIRY